MLLQAGGAGDLVINDNITSDTGNITLDAANQLNIGAASGTPVLVQTGGTGSIVAEAAAADVVMQPDATLQTASGSIHVQAATDVTVGRIVTNSDVAITALAGSITDSDTNDTTTDISANGLRLSAAGSIGDLAGNGLSLIHI